MMKWLKLPIKFDDSGKDKEYFFNSCGSSLEWFPLV